jgi:general stress protein 26
MTTLDDVKTFATALSPWAHLATVSASGAPDVTPVHPCWEGDTLWIMVGTTSVKARNVATNDRVALHWQVSASGDGVEVWGTASVHDDLETKRRLWKGVFDYDLDAFAPGGPDDSEGTGFMRVTPSRALILRQYGMGGAERWRA